MSEPEDTDVSSEACDVLVIGGGAGGSTAASLLARQHLAVAKIWVMAD